MADFTQASKFNKEANFDSVKFGADAPLLETELNELQDIQNYKRQRLAKELFVDGIRDKKDITLTGGTKRVTPATYDEEGVKLTPEVITYDDITVTIKDTTFVVDGDVIDTTILTKAVKDGEKLYLEVINKEVKDGDVIKKYGNEQEVSTVVNEIKDTRVGIETSRRNQVAYNLVTDNTNVNAKYLLLGEHIKGVFNIQVRNYGEVEDYSLPVSTHSNVISLPPNGQIRVSVKGFTATNLIKNGNFKNGTTGWHALKTVSFSVQNDEGVFIGNGSWAEVFTSSFKPLTGHKYYLKADIKANSSLVCLNFSNAPNSSVYHSGGGKYEPLSVLYTNPDTISKALYISDKRSSGWDEVRVKNVILVDLTQTFGAGNEPTKAECDKLFSHYFDGTKSTISAIRVKGVNTLKLTDISDFEVELMNLSNEGEYIVVPPTQGAGGHALTKRKIIVEEGQEIKLKVGVINENLRLLVRFLDEQGNIISDTISGWVYNIYYQGYHVNINEEGVIERTVIVPQGAKYMRCGVASNAYNDVKFKNYIVNEPYQESNLYIQAKDEEGNILELRSLPNGTKDEVSIGSNGTVETRRIKEYVLQANDITEYDEGTNAAQVVIKKPLDSICYNNGLSNANGHSILDGYGYGYSISFDNANVIGKLLSNTSTISYVLIVEKGTYATLTDARTALAGTTLIYQLAKPIEIPIEVSGTLMSYPSGTIYVEKVEKDVVSYKDGIEMQLPIIPNGIESVTLLDKNNRLPINLDKVVRTTNTTNIKLPSHNLTTEGNNYIINTTRNNALRKITKVDDDNVRVTSVEGQTVGDSIVKLTKQNDVTAEAGVNEVQSISLGEASTGTFTLKLSVDNVEQETQPIAVDSNLTDTALNIKTALNALTHLGEGAVINTSVNTTKIDVEFTGGNIGQKDIPLMILTPKELFNGINPLIEEKVKGGGTSNTFIKVVGHGLVTGDYIVNTTRSNSLRKVTKISDDVLQVDSITGQKSGDILEVYKTIGTQQAPIDNVFTIEGAKDGEVYEVVTFYPTELSTNGEFIYSYPQNVAGVIASQGEAIESHSVKLSEHDSMLLGLALKIIDLEGGVL